MNNRNFVNLNVNPCKMCMPMGAALALQGIEETIPLIHGSQGCSTYIRRHICNHYNEPIDIASSSLTEQGTVYGGEENLKQGLKNVIKLYDPQVIGVLTSCLAETIGEDIERMVEEFMLEEQITDKRIVTVATPGYENSHSEGFYFALRRVVESFNQSVKFNNRVNIIAGNLTPGDIRALKRILDLFELKYTLLPDISLNLDAPYTENYQRLSTEGSSVKKISQMGGAMATIELGALVNKEISPGAFLEEQFGVPLYRLALPIGLQNTDQLLELLAKLAGSEIPQVLQNDRGRMLDGMVDSHKHNAQGRVAIFGEPELVYALTGLCLENGIKPLLIATGAKSEPLKELLQLRLEEFEEEPLILTDTDFSTISEQVQRLKPNLLIGDSNGSFITEKEGIPLLRIGFPVHDRIGAQRRVFVGYDGSMDFLDRITNTLLENKYSDYRQRMFEEHYAG